MLRTVHRFARTIALCGAFLALPTLAGAGEWSSGGFGSGAVFVGRGGEINRGVSFGFGEGRGVAVPGGGSIQRYHGGRRYDAPTYGVSRYRTGNRDRFYGDGVVLRDRSFGDRGYGARPIDRWEARRERFEERRWARRDGSFVRGRDSGRIDRFERDPRYDSRRNLDRPGLQGARTLTTFDAYDWGGGGGVVAYGDLDPRSIYQGTTALNRPNAPKILNVETERLDRRPIGPSGLAVTTTSAGSKIIRIAPGYRLAGAASTAQRAGTRSDANLGLQPWSTDWLRYCQRTHRSFDPDLGTYVTPNGRVAFCSAE